MIEPLPEPAFERLHKLKEIVLRASLEGDTSSDGLHLLAQEGLLDALLVLYDEYQGQLLKSDPVIKDFIKKYEGAIKELRKMRVNLNDFEQKKIIGKGHFGIVQVVREKQTGSVYALKTLRKTEMTARQHIAFYEEERDIMAKALSPWITKLQYAFQDELHLYLVMDFHPGGDLLSLLDRFDYAFNEEMIRFYLSEIIVAVHAVHNMGYLHRDVKPDNVLIDRCGHIKLADFGSSAKLPPSGVIRGNMAVGTPDYISPEVLSSIDGCNSDDDPGYGVECDFWSIGIVAYEMLFGETPFKGEKAIDTYSNIQNHKETFHYPSEMSTSISSSLKELIEGLLETPDKRLNYNSLIRHKFFLQIDWNNLDAVRPPFIPVVTSVDDTSNFEEFDGDVPAPSTDAFNTRRAFSGRQLPFIGFTYVRPLSDECSDSPDTAFLMPPSSIESSKDVSMMEFELKVKTKELHEANLTITKLAESEPPQQTHQLERRAVKAENRLRLLENERERLEDEAKKREGLLQKLKNNLSMEKSERAKTESKTLEFLKDIKKKWKTEEEQRINRLNEKLKMYKEVAEKISAEKEEALEKWKNVTFELNQSKTDCHNYRKKIREMEKLNKEEPRMCTGECSQAREHQQSLDDTIQQLQKEKDHLKEVSLGMEQLQSKVSEFENEREELLEHFDGENRSLKEKVAQLQQHLHKSTKEEKNAQNQIKELKEKVLVSYEEKMKNLESCVRQEKTQCQQLKDKLQDAHSKLNESMASLNSRDLSFQDIQDQMDQKVKELQGEVKTASKEKNNLFSELSRFKAKDGEKQRKINELESLMKNLKEALTKLESRHSSGQSPEQLQAQVDLLEKQLEAVQTSAASDKEQFHIAQENLRKKERDCTDLRLDYRSSQRDLKASQDSNQYLRDKHREMKEEIKGKEDQLLKMEQKQTSLENEIQNLRDEIEDLKKTHSIVLRKKQADLEEVENQIKAKDASIAEVDVLRKDLLNALNEKDKLKLEKQSLSTEIKLLEKAKIGQAQSESKLKESLQAMEKKLHDSQMTLDQLKEICSEQDAQLDALDQFEEKMNQVQEEKKLLSDKLEDLQTELKNAKVATNEEKSLKLFQERHAKDLELRLSNMEQDHDQIISNLQDQVEQYSKENIDLNSQVSEYEKALLEAKSKDGAQNHEILSLQDQVDLVIGESASHVELIQNLKNSNLKLTEGLEEAVSKGESLKKRLEEANRSFKQAQSSFTDKEYCLKSTIAQQTKLIAFLQTKIDNPPKKKGFSSLFGGGSSNKEKEGTSYMPPHYNREIEDLLAREKAHSRQLSSQLSKAHAEVVALKAQANSRDVSKTPLPTKVSKTPLGDLSNSPDVHSRSSKRRMRHKVPHRWQSHLVMEVGRCAGCMESIPFSRNAFRCIECGVMAHTKCSEGIANTCGLPDALAHQYLQAMKRESSHQGQASPESKSLVEGWLKIPDEGKASWSERYGRLTSNSLHFYEQKPVAALQPVLSLCLPQKGKSLLSPSIPHSEVPSIPESQLPYVFKIDGLLIGGEPYPLYILTSNFDDRLRWLSALETHVSQLTSAEGAVRDPLSGSISSKVLVSLKSAAAPLDVNTLAILNKNTVLVGATEGLFSFERDATSGKMKFRARIDGLSSVHQILLVKSLNVAIFIAGKDNLVFLNPIQTLTTAAEAAQILKPSLSPKSIDPLFGCHLIDASNHSDKKIFLCAAASDRISILVWSNEKETFIVCRQYSTQEPCSCFLFTPRALIVGSERFYTIDLKNFEIEEFLDKTDNSLAYAIYGSTQMSSLPVSIIQVSNQGCHEEYLLAFYEFALFVDSKGRRTREMDVKFTRLPLGILFQHPYLYILHQNCVEVIEIRAESYTKVRSMSFDSDAECCAVVRTTIQKLSKPRFIGKADNHKDIFMVTSYDDHLEILATSASFPDDPNCSFISSIGSPSPLPEVQSCDSASQASNISSSTLQRSESAASNESDSTNNSFKRTKLPSFMRVSKRSKKAI